MITPKPIAIQAYCGSTKLWPTAKPTKKGDHAADVTIPLMAASAAARRSASGLSGGKTADSMAKVPVLMIPPKK